MDDCRNLRRAVHRGRLFPLLGALLATLVLVGCQSSPKNQRTTATATHTAARPSLADLTVQDWANIITDLNCMPVNRGVEILGTRFADVRGIGVKDAFVWVDCYHETSSWPQQLEVFDGSSDPANPRRMAVLVSADEPMLIRSLSFARKAVTVDAAGYATNDPTCCPSVPLHRVFVWTGERFRQESG